MEKALEEKLISMILRDIREISNSEDSITKKYYDCYNYLNLIIDTDANNVSEWLLNELYTQRLYYHHKYLVNKDLL